MVKKTKKKEKIEEIPEEHEEYTKGKWWYISFIIISIGLLIYAILDKNYTFAIILILFLLLYTFHEKTETRTFDINITEDGILINDKIVEYKNIDHFYIIYHPPMIKKLYLQPKSVLQHRITIPLEDINPVELREILLMYLEEDLEKEEEPTSESLTKILKL